MIQAFVADDDSMWLVLCVNRFCFKARLILFQLSEFDRILNSGVLYHFMTPEDI